MTRYTAEELENRFKRVGVARKKHKKFADDAGYWDGGTCNWGANHNLHEDCQTLANAFNKIDSLGSIKKELLATTSEAEFNAKKENFLRKVQEAERGLNIQTAVASSAFGICIIWEDEASDRHVKGIREEVKTELGKIKSSLKKETYKWIEEIRQLDLEIGKIEQEIQRQRKEVQNEEDPIRRTKIMQEIEDNGKILQHKYQKKQELSNRFNFNPGRKVKNWIDAIKKALDKKDKRNNKNKTPRTPRNTNTFESSSSDASSDESSEEFNGGASNNNEQENETDNNSNWFQENQKLVIFIGISLLAIIFLYSYQEEN